MAAIITPQVYYSMSIAFTRAKEIDGGFALQLFKLNVADYSCRWPLVKIFSKLAPNLQIYCVNRRREIKLSFFGKACRLGLERVHRNVTAPEA